MWCWKSVVCQSRNVSLAESTHQNALVPPRKGECQHQHQHHDGRRQAGLVSVDLPRPWGARILAVLVSHDRWAAHARSVEGCTYLRPCSLGTGGHVLAVE
jgi:hypothetical protein